MNVKYFVALGFFALVGAVLSVATWATAPEGVTLQTQLPVIFVFPTITTTVGALGAALFADNRKI